MDEVIKPVLPDGARLAQDQVLHQPDRPLRRRRADGRLGPHRPQDHRRHLRRHGPSRRRRLLGQGSVEGRSLGLLLRALHRQERRGGRAGAPLRGAGRLRHRRRASRSRCCVHTFGTGTISEERHRASSCARTSTAARARSSASSNLLRPIYQKTAAYGHFGRSEKDFTWEQPNKAAALAAEARSIQPVRSSANGNGHANGNGSTTKPAAKKPARKSFGSSTPAN